MQEPVETEVTVTFDGHVTVLKASMTFDLQIYDLVHPCYNTRMYFDPALQNMVATVGDESAAT